MLLTNSMLVFYRHSVVKAVSEANINASDSFLVDEHQCLAYCCSYGHVSEANIHASDTISFMLIIVVSEANSYAYHLTYCCDYGCERSEHPGV